MSDPKPIRRVSARKYRGLGDVVAAVARPVAVALDKVLGTALEGCTGCGARRERWNRKWPLRKGGEDARTLRSKTQDAR